MIKNFTRIRQWAGEKLGASRGTLPSEEFKDFQLETKLRHEDFDEMRHTISAAIKHIPLKKNSRDGNHRQSLIGDFGESLVTHASMFPNDSVYWKMLTSLGQGERQLSEAEGDFADAAKDNYMALLFDYDQRYKEYLSLCRKLESRRLDYDAKYNQLRKAKKERPECEQNVQAAKVKYEETELDVVQSMIYLQETEVDHCDRLYSLLDSQLDFHKKAFDILEQVKCEWDTWTENCTTTGFSPIATTPNQFSNGTDKSHGDDRTKPTLRRALYEHIQDLDDELTFHANDIITVLHKVDDGWWLGELKDKNNLVYRGIFPVNYTEPYTDDNNNDYSIKITDTNDNRECINKIGDIQKTSNQSTERISDQIDNASYKIMENSKHKNHQDNVENSNTDIGHTASKTNDQASHNIYTQNIVRSPSTYSSSSTSDTPLSSFVSPSITSPVSGNEDPTNSQVNQSPPLSPSSSSKSSVAATPLTALSSLPEQHDQDNTSTTSIAPDHQKPSTSSNLSTTTPSENYYRPLPPIPLDD